tara:strand:- start:40 stop:423 length:384 start_codon:yes stop_codon:yes gene_type:complete
MNRHKHLARLERLKDAIFKRYGRRGVLEESDFPDGGVWAIWLGLLKDIRECGFSTVFKIDGVRLYYYNEMWKMVNGKDHAPLDTPPKFKNTNSMVVRYKDMEFDGPLDRAEWISKEPLPDYMWTEAK